MNKWIIITALLAFALTSCHQLSQRAEAEQSTDRTKVVTSAAPLRMVITDKHLSHIVERDMLQQLSPSCWPHQQTVFRL
jgi:hypothetical protein